MKTYLTKILIFLFIALNSLPAYSALNMISKNNIFVGEIYDNFKCTNDFVFVNSGRTDINVIRVMPTCTCITGSSDISKVKPGQKLKVTLIFDADGIHGKFSRGAWLITDAPTGNKTRLQISGEVLPLFKGFPEERILLSAKDETSSFTNTFTFTATTTNYFLNHPTSDKLFDNVEYIWNKQTLGITNIWRLTSIIKPTKRMKDSASIRVPVTGPKEVSDRVIHFNLCIGVALRASPPKLITTTLVQPFVKRVYINTCYTAIQDANLLTWEPQIKGLTIKKKLNASRHKLSKFTNQTSGSKARFSCTISASPEALKELMKMQNPGFTFSYPDHQPITIPLILYNPADTKEDK